MLYDHIEWDDANIEHATRHGVSMTEIEQVIDNAETVQRNRRHRSGDVRFQAKTDAGRPVVVVAAYDPARDAVRAITAWERR